MSSNRERTEQMLASDFAAVQLFNALNPAFSFMFFGFENTVTTTAEILAQYDIDLVIAIPIKNKQNLETVFKNLANIDLQGLKAGIIFGLDKFNDPEWYYANLKQEIAKISSRFVFVEPFKTTLVIPKGYDTGLYKLLVDEITKMGMRNFQGLGIVFNVIREEIRMVIKALNCKYVLWLDADELVPQEVISRLMRHTDKADLVAGWAIDRHYPFEKTTFETLTKHEPQTKKESEYYEMVNKFLNDMGQTMTQYANFALMQMGQMSRQFIRSSYNVILPSKVRVEKEPIAVNMTGFGCVLVNKLVNDRASFLTISDDSIAMSEDAYFCKCARDLGYKLVVDPTCFCEHVEDKENEVKENGKD